MRSPSKTLLVAMLAVAQLAAPFATQAAGAYEHRTRVKGLVVTTTPTAQPAADLSAATVTFPGAPVGEPAAAQTVLVLNTGNVPLTLGAVGVTKPFTAGFDCPSSLAPGAQCAIGVNFTPTTVGQTQGTLTVETSVRTLTATLVGTGQEARGSLAPNTSSNFGPVALLSSAARTFTFTNTGTAPATGVYAQTASGSAALVLSANSCGTQASKVSLAPGATCSFTATWTPGTTAALNDSVQVLGAFADAPASVAVTGTVASATWTSIATSLGWEMASPFTRATYNNSVTLCTQDINGKTGWRMPTQAEFETQRAAMNIAINGWPATSNDYYWTSTPYTAGTHVVRLATTGGSYAVDSDLHYPVCVRTFAAGALTANAGVGYGNVPLTTQDEKTFTFTAGSVALTGVTPSVSGSSDLSISATTCTSTLAAGASCTVSVRYAPTSISTLSNAKVSVASSAENSPASLTLTGAGVADTTVVSLLHFDGANAGTTVLDSTTSNNWTNTGVTLTTANKQFGTAAGSFNASSYAVSTQNVAFGSGNFTAELWFYPTRIVAYEYLLGQLIPNNNSSWWLGIYNGKLTVGAWNGVSWTVQSPNNVTLNAWNHAALVRSGSQLRLYLNGALVSSNSNGVPAFVTTKVSVGIAGPTWTDAPFSGLIDEVRISNGAARYSGSTYTVPTAPF